MTGTATVVGTFAGLAIRILAQPPRLGGVRLVAVDGAAGSGKSTFAARLAAALRAAGATVVDLHTDDLLNGWGDIVGFWPRLEEGVLAPLRRSQPGAYRPYDWHAGCFEENVRAVPVPDVLVVEGVTSGRAAIRPDLTLLVWVAAPEGVRLARGVGRDGEALRPDWVRWMAAEAAHFAEDRPADHADILVDGAPVMTSHDPEVEFVRIVGGRG